jgi:TolB protein
VQSLLRVYSPVLLLALAFAAPLAAQDTTSVVRLRATYEVGALSGFVVLPFGGGGELEAAATLSSEIVRRDLDFSDQFKLAEATGARPGDAPNIALWRERGADWVLTGTLAPRAGGSTLRLTLVDAVYGQTKGEGSFELPAASDRRFRMAVHAASDAVVRWATGEPGIAATRIAFVTQGRGSKEIYLVDSDGENVTRVTSDGSLALSPAWSPDGGRIAYTSYRGGMPALYERDLASGSDRVLSQREGLNITPSYAPDGRTVAFAATAGGNTEIATVGASGFRQQTTGRSSDNLSPSFSPDGARIAFVSNRLGEPQIYVMSANGGEARLISDYTYGNRGYSTSPDWAPAGGRIAFHTRVGGAHQIAMVDAEGNRPRLLTSGSRNEDPSWAPDGRHLVFSSPDRDGGGLFVLDTKTGRVRKLLAGRGHGLPDWSPVLMRAGGR